MIAIEHHPGRAKYSRLAPYHPDSAYPEYQWAETVNADAPNAIYAMLRAMFVRLELDTRNFNTSAWNPLGELIHPGMTVLLKPNMVLNWHPVRPDESLDSLITHPSLVRAVMDYVVIALRGQGRIVVGDAALQSCDFNDLLKKQGYNQIETFYKSKGIDVAYVDFRQVASVYNEHNILETKEINSDPLGYKIVDMCGKSAHVPECKRCSRYRVTNYDHKKMALYHSINYNKYLIAGTPLSADIVITLPKLKVHRKAGITCSLKSFVGIIGHKDCLPHHTRNSVTEGGDEYLQKNFFKRCAVRCLEWMNIFSINREPRLARFMQSGAQLFWRLSYRLNTDPFAEGSWYGNDTIWRTTLDLVRIITYADRDGILRDTPQRKLFAVIDGIVAGEGEGPLHSSAKAACLLAGGSDLVALDYVMSVIMGFEPQNIPTIDRAFLPHDLPLTANKPENIQVNSNNPDWDAQMMTTLPVEKTLQFVPPAHWKGHVERQE